ncbi:MAG: hypothetical protein QGI49_04610, partial [SAR202 cluster bacterium]|nr:hypothetical protein [SAR202 cluster bacterium]
DVVISVLSIVGVGLPPALSALGLFLLLSQICLKVAPERLLVPAPSTHETIKMGFSTLSVRGPPRSSEPVVAPLVPRRTANGSHHRLDSPIWTIPILTLS